MIEVLLGDCRSVPLADRSINSIIASPPYWGVQDYGVEGSIGRADTIDQYVLGLVCMFREFARVLRDLGTLWFIIGDQHPEFKGLPWLTALALQNNGWRIQKIFIWNYGDDFDHVFMMSKEPLCYFNAINDNPIWNIPEEPPYPGALFKPLPRDLIHRCIKYGCPREGILFNPFSGAGSVGLLAAQLGVRAVLMDLDPGAVQLTRTRIDKYHEKKNNRGPIHDC